MAGCFYHVNGKWLTESQFKKVLEDGLLDQLIANQNFDLPGFKINNKLLAKYAEPVDIGPVKLQVHRKVNSTKTINNQLDILPAKEGQTLGHRTRPSRRSPRTVIEESNKQIASENKRLGTKRGKNRMWFVTKVGGKIKYGDSLDPKIIEDMTKNKGYDLEGNLQEGKIYMLVPSAYGTYPLLMRNSFLGETKVAGEVKKALKEMLALEGEAFSAKAKEVTRYLYKTSFNKNADGSIEVTAERAGGNIETGPENTFNNISDLSSYVLGDYVGGELPTVAEGNPSPQKGLLAKVDHLKLNSVTKDANALGNIFYADKGFVTTDSYTEGGNFFNSSSFIIGAYQATGDDLKILREVLDSLDLEMTPETAEAAAVTEETVEPAIPNQNTKKDETPINDRTLEGVQDLQSFIVEMPGSQPSVYAKVYVQTKGNSLEMYKIQKVTKVKRENANDTFQPSPKQFTSTEESAVRKEALPKFNELKKEFGTKDITLPEGGVHQEPAAPQDVGTGLFDMAIAVEDLAEDDFPDFDFGGDASTGEDLDLNPKTRLTTQQADGTKMSQEQQVDWLRNKLGDLTLEGNFSVFNSIEDLQRYLPTETYEMLLEARKNGQHLQGLFSEAAVHLANNAMAGTGYHEAFHVIFNLGLNLEQRLTLLEEAVDNYGEEIPVQANLVDIEEVLADKFIEYVNADEAVESPARISRAFKGMYRGIRLFYSKDSKVSIDRVFEDIQLGVYKNQIEFKNTDFSKINPDNVKLRATRRFIDPRFEAEIFEYAEYKLFKLIDSARKGMHTKENPTKHLTDGQMIELITKRSGVRTLYGLLLHAIDGDKKLNASKGKDVSDLNKVLGYFTEGGTAIEMKAVGNSQLPIFTGKPPHIVEKFNRHLRQRGIIINIDAIEDYEADMSDTSLNDNYEESTAEERWQRAHIEIDPTTTLSQLVKRRLGTIPKLISIDGEPQMVRNSFGAPVNYTEQEVFGFIGQTITDSYSPTEMVEKLEALKEKKPFISTILNYVEEDVNFKTSLYTTLASKTFQKALMVYEENGVYKTFYSNRKTVDNLIKEDLIANFIVDGNPLFNSHTGGNQKGQTNFESPNLDRVTGAVSGLDSLLKRAKETESEKELYDIVSDLSKFLEKNYIYVTPEQLIEIWGPATRTVDGKKEFYFIQKNWDRVRNVMNSAKGIMIELANRRNPFLEMRPDQDGYKSVMEKFVRSVKAGMDNEVIASYRNGDNKTVYAIQYSNHLTKLISEFKTPEGVAAWKERNARDPLLMSMPFVQDLVKEGRGTPLQKELEAVTFDSLARKGKSKSVPYGDLSDIEMEAMAMAVFHKSGNTNYGYYKLPTPSDGTILPLIKGERYSQEVVMDKLLQVALGEIKRIKEFDSLPEDSMLRMIPNYRDKAQTFQVLSFLNGKIDPFTYTSEMEVKAAIEEYLQGDFLELHKKQWKRAGIILDYEKGPKGNITFADKVITKSLQGQELGFFKDYLYNSFYMNSQMTTIFAGDPAYYKGTTDYQKRYKQIISPGTLTNADLVDDEYHGIILNDEEVPTVPEVLTDIEKLINNSDLPATKKKELVARIRSQKHNVTDAATFVSVDRAMQKLASLGRLTPEHKAAAKRIKNGIESSNDAALFQVEKPFMFTKINVDGREVPVQIKNSEVLLTKAFAEQKWKKGEEGVEGEFKYPKLVEVYRLLNNPAEGEPKLAFAAFESAVKVGALGTEIIKKKDGSEKVRFNELMSNADGSYSLNAAPTVLTLKQSDWRLQQETPEHYIDESGNFGSQIRNLMIGDMEMEGTYIVNGKPYKGHEVARMYQELIVANLKESFEQVEDMFLNEDKSVNYARIVGHLKEEMKSRNLDEEYFEAIELIDEYVQGEKTGNKTTVLPLWHPLVSYKVESLLNSFFKNRITKQKIKGGNMVNATSYGVSDNLEFYMDEKGNYQMEALLPWWSRKFFPKNDAGEIDVDSMPTLLSKLIGYRIPTEDKYSVFNIKVVGFTDPAAGGQIILPVEATTQAGLDFDIDKLFMIVPEYRITKDGEIKYKSYITKESTTEEVVDAILDSNKSFLDFVETYVSKSEQEALVEHKESIDKKIYEILKAKKNYKGELDSKIRTLRARIKNENDVDTIKGLKQELSEAYEQTKDTDDYDGAVAVTSQEYKDIKEDLAKWVNEKVDPSQYEPQFNSTPTRNNRILEIMRGIMENKNTALSIVDGGNFDHLKEIGNKTRVMQIPADAEGSFANIRKEGRKVVENFKEGSIGVAEYREKLQDLADKLDDVDFNINLPATQLTLFRRNMTGKKLIPIFANHNTHHAKAQHTDLQLTVPIELDGKEYQMLNKIYDETGLRISKSLAIKLAAVVDNAKDPISAYLNMNTYTANMIAMLSRLGVSEDVIFAFVNQPSIIELTNKYFNERGSLADEKEMIASIKQNWVSKMLKHKLDHTDVDEEGLDMSLEEMENALDGNESVEYYKTQYKALQNFDKFRLIANELNQGVQASRVDTQGMGPSQGDNYVMVNKQQKVLNKEEPHIQNMKQMLLTSSNQILNPAFNEYAWIRPMGIMNKIFPSVGTMDTLTGGINYSLLGRIKNMFSDMKGEYFSLSESEARAIDTAFMSYLGSEIPFFDNKESKEVLENVPERLRKFKNKYPGSIFSPFLNQLYVKDGDKSVKMRRIEYYATGKGPLDSSTSRRLWREMFSSKDKTSRDLAFDLVKYAYFSNGFAFGPHSFFNMVPVTFWRNDFAKDPNNNDKGLTTQDGRSMNELMADELRAMDQAIFMNNGYLNVKAKGPIYNFIKQYVQNSAEKSLIVPNVKINEGSRTFTPDTVTKLDKDEVFVFGTTMEGAHNVGSAGIAFKGNINMDNVPQAKGFKGRWTEYGKTGQVTQGNHGRGFGLRMQKAEFEGDSIKTIKGIKTLDKPTRQRLMGFMKNDIETLSNIAEEEPGTKFIVDHLYKNTGWSTKEVRDILKQVNDAIGIPNNIILPKYLEVRNKKGTYIESKTMKGPDGKEYTVEHLVVGKGANSHRSIKDGVFPSFFKVSHNGALKLFEIDPATINKDFLRYIRIPLLGTSNFVKEFSYNKEITHSVVPELTIDTKTEPDALPPITGDDPALLALQVDTMAKMAQEQEEAQNTDDPLGAMDVNDNALFVEKATPEEIKEVPYSVYQTQSKGKNVAPMTATEWAAMDAAAQKGIMDYLKTC